MLVRPASMPSMPCEFSMQGSADWNHLFHELRRFRAEHGQEGPPFKWRDPVADFTSSFARWYHKQPDLFRQRLLLPDEARALWGTALPAVTAPGRFARPSRTRVNHIA